MSMPKMKHLLRKLHIGGGLNEHHRFGDTRPVPSPTPSPTAPASSSSAGSSTSVDATVGRTGTFESVGDRMAWDGGASDGCVDFNLLEEEFQVQLALAISASDPDGREDPETAQIDAAKRISLGCSAPVSDSQALVKFLSLRYWVGREFRIPSIHQLIVHNSIVCELERVRSVCQFCGSCSSCYGFHLLTFMFGSFPQSYEACCT